MKPKLETRDWQEREVIDYCIDQNPFGLNALRMFDSHHFVMRGCANFDLLARLFGWNTK